MAAPCAGVCRLTRRVCICAPWATSSRSVERKPALAARSMAVMPSLLERRLISALTESNVSR
eukprot:6205347-Pleurochrysis_carterae.AAC.1